MPYQIICMLRLIFIHRKLPARGIDAMKIDIIWTGHEHNM